MFGFLRSEDCAEIGVRGNNNPAFVERPREDCHVGCGMHTVGPYMDGIVCRFNK